MNETIRRTVMTLSIAALAAGCNQPEIVTALDRTFHLGVGRQAVFPSQQLELGFARAVDSRCPEGTNCMRAGEAIVTLWMGPEGGRKPEVFEARIPASASPDSATVVEHGDYRIRLIGLEPRPKASQPVDTTAYVLELRVTRR